MKRTFVRVAIIAAAIVVGNIESVRAADKAVPASASLTLSGFYTGPLGHTGQFRGKLLCLCCDLTPGGDKKACDADGHHHVLMTEGDAMLHPLVTGTAEAMKQINSDALHDKQVVVTGSYYPSTGFIFVSKVELQ